MKGNKIFRSILKGKNFLLRQIEYIKILLYRKEILKQYPHNENVYKAIEKKEDITREETINNHKKIWNWIAYHTIREKKIITKEEYFNTFLLNKISCFGCICEYAKKNRNKDNIVKPTCSYCIGEWGESTNCRTYFYQWIKSKTWLKRYYWANKIANIKMK